MFISKGNKVNRHENYMRAFLTAGESQWFVSHYRQWHLPVVGVSVIKLCYYCNVCLTVLHRDR